MMAIQQIILSLTIQINMSKPTVYFFMIKKDLNFIANSYCFQLTFHASPKPKVRPQKTVAESVTSILFSQNVVTKKFYSLVLKFMKL